MKIWCILIFIICVISACCSNQTENTHSDKTAQQTSDVNNSNLNPWLGKDSDIDSSKHTIDSILRTESKFKAAQYRQWKHFDLWKMEPYGKVDSDTFVYVKNSPTGFVLRMSYQPDNPIVIIKKDGYSVLYYNQELTVDQLETIYFKYRRVECIAFISDNRILSVVQCLNDKFKKPNYETYKTIWQVFTPDKIYYYKSKKVVPPIRFSENLYDSLTYETQHASAKSGTFLAHIKYIIEPKIVPPIIGMELPSCLIGVENSIGVNTYSSDDRD